MTATIDLTPAHALRLWREALACEVGLAIPINQVDLDQIKHTMYAARKAAEDPALMELKLCVAPGGEAIWLVKKPKEAP